ncbi:hypothetical protein GCM10018962_80410 [Dactylosporangium matsuzakiense]|uniref:Uncharacterized protein n=1 Tax=Dactylosporangium matsuzakiense TaxID=53360 RepID=A0A9W6KQ24_9ACTN|nr:hypothetical protein GCM10017581_068990 [Dactylosporangium matsuzakiense]
MGSARRLGVSPTLRCSSDVNCPDLFELADGRIAVIGTAAGQEILAQLPADASIGPDEVLVVMDRRILLDAKPDIALLA